MIDIVGLGPGARDDITLSCINIMKNADNVYLRTCKHPNVDYLKEQGISFSSFDQIYDEGDSFDQVYEAIAEKIVCQDNVVYAVPGHPLIAEKSVQLILKLARKNGKQVCIHPALSFIDAVVNVLQIDPIDGLKIIDGLQLWSQRPDISTGNIITQVYSRMVASDIKLKLMETYSDDQDVVLIRAAGVPGLEKAEHMPLYEIDRVEWVDYLTSLYIPPVKQDKQRGFEGLLKVMEMLRSENGCPWDKEQNHETLKRYLIEESYEVADAIESRSMDALCEELGDVLLQVVFHSQIAKEFGEFNINDVIQGIIDKMINRHPHVFGDEDMGTSEQVLDRWEEIKLEEKHMTSVTENLQAIPRVMPSLMRSYKIQEKAAKVGFEWDNVGGAIDKIHEELNEFLEVYKTQNNGKITEELGDLLFSIVNACRYLDVDPELALSKTCEKFISRFGFIEKECTSQGRKLNEMTLNEMDSLWNVAKSKLS